VHWDGATWSPVTSNTTVELHSVWGTGPGDAWAVGDTGTILHWDGGAWNPSNSGTSNALLGVWGCGVNQLWTVGRGGTVLQHQ
jgi:hypothetical protein